MTKSSDIVLCELKLLDGFIELLHLDGSSAVHVSEADDEQYPLKVTFSDNEKSLKLCWVVSDAECGTLVAAWGKVRDSVEILQLPAIVRIRVHEYPFRKRLDISVQKPPRNKVRRVAWLFQFSKLMRCESREGFLKEAEALRSKGITEDQMRVIRGIGFKFMYAVESPDETVLRPAFWWSTSRANPEAMFKALDEAFDEE